MFKNFKSLSEEKIYLNQAASNLAERKELQGTV